MLGGKLPQWISGEGHDAVKGYIDAGLLLLDGDVVTSLDDPAPDGSGRFVIAGS